MTEQYLATPGKSTADIPLSHTWEQPQRFYLGISEDNERFHEVVGAALRDRGDVRLIDPAEEIAHDMFEYDHPSEANDPVARDAYVRERLQEGDALGTFVYFGWKNTVVRYPDQTYHRGIRTFRETPLVTQQEQQLLGLASIVAGGLSVGSNAIFAMARAGIGSSYLVADPDKITGSNLNRIGATTEDIGKSKAIWTAQQLSMIDPYMRITPLLDGVIERDMSRLDEVHPDLIVEAADNFAAKALLRIWARDNRVPLIMPTDVDDKAMVDVERYDIGSPELFLGRLDRTTIQACMEGSMDARVAMLKLTGIRNISTNMMYGALQEGKTIAGLPQKGTTAQVAGALVAVAAREILLNTKLPDSRHSLPSGRYRQSARDTLRLPRTHAYVQTLRAVKALGSEARERAKERTSRY